MKQEDVDMSRTLCESETVKSSSERSCSHVLQPVTLSEVKRSGLDRVHHVRVQLRSYEPQRLHQALKLYCSKCTSMRDVPDEELVAGLFRDAFRSSGPCSPPSWLLSGEVDICGDGPGSVKRTLTVLLSSELLPGGKDKELLFLMGSTLEDTCRLTDSYQNIVPVRSSGGHLTLLDLTAPFLFTGKRRYYGCKRCSAVSLKEPNCEGVDVIDVKMISEAVGVQLLQFVMLMKLRLQDDTDTLDVFLWRDAEQFFSVSAEDAPANQETQRIVQQTMDTLCPPGGSTGSGERPWLDLCLTSYQGEDDEGQNQTCYQICHTSVTRPASMRSGPGRPEPPPPPPPPPAGQSQVIVLRTMSLCCSFSLMFTRI
ncbi:hypothetical protein INR49_018922 [Caranx melampygus]|nr:hypothetical protein INR49_018922 [Caranx melampygus]